MKVGFVGRFVLMLSLGSVCQKARGNFTKIFSKRPKEMLSIAFWSRGGRAGVNAFVLFFSQPSGQVITKSSKVKRSPEAVVTVTWWWFIDSSVFRGGASMFTTGWFSLMSAWV